MNFDETIDDGVDALAFAAMARAGNLRVRQMIANDKFCKRSYYSAQDIETKKLTAEQERDLFERLAADRGNSKLRDEVVRAFLGFALMQAKKDIRNRSFSTLMKTGLSEDDAISAANFGLMQAIDRFDPKNGARFTTYAGWWIKKALHEARYSAHVVTVPRGDREAFVLYKRQEADGLTVDQIAEFNKVEKAEVERVLALAGGRQDPIEMFEAGETNAAKASCAEVLAASPAEGMEHEELLEKLEAAKNRLGPEELRLLHDRFSRKLSIKRIAAKNSCSTHHVETRIASILHVLRLHLSR